MFTNKEINTLIGMFFAASCTPATDPVQYHEGFTNALREYFLCYPNLDENDDIYEAGEFPADEE